MYVNTAQESDGSDSGARPDEAVTWGKIKADAKPVKVFLKISEVDAAVATFAFPGPGPVQTDPLLLIASPTVPLYKTITQLCVKIYVRSHYLRKRFYPIINISKYLITNFDQSFLCVEQFSTLCSILFSYTRLFFCFPGGC